MDIIILGAGGHGRVVLDIVYQAQLHNPVAFLDNNKALHGRRVDGLPVPGGMEQLAALKARGIHGAVIAIGDNGVRRAMGDLLEQHSFEVLSAIHPSANNWAGLSCPTGPSR